MLTRTGYLVNEGPIQEIKKDLTVRPIVNGDFGFPPPPFKVFRPTKNGVCVPRFYGTAKLGDPKEDKRPEPTRIKTKFARTAQRRYTPKRSTRSSNSGRSWRPFSTMWLREDDGIPGHSVQAWVYSTMIVVHKQFLADQWRERIQQFCPGATIGVVQQDKKEVDCDFVIAMLQSLSLKEYSFTDFDSVGTLIVDEAHHICAKVFSQSPSSRCALDTSSDFQQLLKGKMVSPKYFTGSWVPTFFRS
jgi:hypothetical protein